MNELLHELPYISGQYPGIGGTIKLTPAAFVVEEIPLYEPVDQGEHIYIVIEREGMTTRDVQKSLASLLGLKAEQIGCAGLKDKQARVTQTFSLHAPALDITPLKEQIETALSVKVLSVRRHQNKLRTGHLLGNRFHIQLQAPSGTLQDALTILDFLKNSGVPNFYGEQRFGHDKDNAEQGLQILRGEKRAAGWLRRLLLSAYQARLFNCWLTERIEAGNYERILVGDVAKKTDTGGMFRVEDESTDQERLNRHEIIYTGPIYGKKMNPAAGLPAEREKALLEREGVSAEDFRKAGVLGTRRMAKFYPRDCEITPIPEGLLFSFFLPKGCYATVLLREFMKNDAAAQVSLLADKEDA